MNNLPTPEMVRGFQEALNAGLLPHVPQNPPRPVTISSTKILLICIVSFFITGFIGIEISNMEFSPTWLDISIMILPLLSAFASFYLPGRARDQEYAAGYSYVDDAVMTYRAPLSKFFKFQNQAGPAGYQWNFRGLWKLNNNGSVDRPPVVGALPIGYYPSPTNQGEYQYWTGAEWISRYLPLSAIPQGGRLIP